MGDEKLIADQKSWDSIAGRLSGEKVLALDTEGNSMYAYRERICLVQIATGDAVFLLDPLAVGDLSSLGGLLADPAIVKVFHGCDYDLRCLDRDYGFRVRSLFDTETAARFLGCASPNLAAVLETFLGVTIPKSKRLQRSNWGYRPLSGQALDYAASDVLHLPSLAEELRRRLRDLGRLGWVEEEWTRLEGVRYAPPDPPERAFLRVKGSDRLSPRALAVLREVFLAREKTARRLDCPGFRVMSNEDMLSLARNLRVPPAQYYRLPGRIARQFAADLQTAVDRGMTGPEAVRPARPDQTNPWDPDSRARLQRLKEWRSARGAALGMDPALLWPMGSLERLALDPASWKKELDGGAASGEVRRWQRHELAPQLKALMNGGGPAL